MRNKQLDRTGLGLLASFLIGLGCARNAWAITLNFSGLDGSDLNFWGSQFTFSSVSANDPDQFYVASVDGPGSGDSLGLDGYIAPGGPFTIGTITIQGIHGVDQSAPVTGTGIVHITDNDGVDLTGSMQWENIENLGIGGILNLTGLVNVTSITYPSNFSSDPSIDLETLAAGGDASDVVTFQFSPGMDLQELVQFGDSTSYGGSITNNTLPEPTPIALAGLGAAGLMARRRPRLPKSRHRV